MYLWLVILQASTSSSHYTKPDLYHYNLIQDESSNKIDVNIIRLKRVKEKYVTLTNIFLLLSVFLDIVIALL